MEFFHISLLILIQAAALLTAMPAVRLPREVAAPQITVIQTSLSGSGQSIHDVPTNYCINVRDDDIPTKIQLTQSDTGPYKLISFSNDCSQEHIEVKKQTLRNPRIVNDRKPICSFKLKQSEEVAVAFSGSTSTTFQIADTQCYNICSGSETVYPSLAYALTVDITRANGEIINNGIQLFSETGCETPIEETLESGSNLVKMTRQDQRVVKSFMIKE